MKRSLVGLRIGVMGLALAATLGATSISRAADAPSEEVTRRGPFERPFALSGYGVAWTGAYTAVGVGGRLRWEMVPGRFGVELLAEHLIVDWPGGFRHDHPIGFNLYVPFALSRNVRLRVLAGACTVFSFVEPEHAGAPRADDILFGLHGGAGLEIALHERVSWFFETQAIGYLAHDRTGQGWTGSVGNSERPIAVFQPTTGLQIHIGK
jgi:hypothetical protein